MPAPAYNVGIIDDGMEKHYFALVSDPNKIEYVCKAAPGTGTDKLLWQIQKWTWSGNFLSKIQYANNDAGFLYAADSRIDYF